MAAIKTAKAEKLIEDIEQTEFEANLPALIKVSDNLYVPENFEEDHNYYSDPSGTKRYYGITNVLSVIAKPALIQWAANMACDYLEEKLKYTLEPDGSFNPKVMLGFLAEARVAHAKKKEKAGEDGTDVHFQLERLIKTAIELNNGKLEALNVTEDTPEQVKEFVQWAIINDVTFLASEQRLYSKKLWVAGTADFVALIRGKLYIGDIKTNNSGIYPEHMIQTTAYAFMAKEMGLFEDFYGVVIVNVPKRGGIKVQENYDLKGNFNAFKACLTIHKFLEAQKVKKEYKSTKKIINI